MVDTFSFSIWNIPSSERFLLNSSKAVFLNSSNLPCLFL
jgi:hypothetical protein